jgi:hypothetical protein
MSSPGRAAHGARPLEVDPAELAHPDPGQDPQHRGERHAGQLGDLGAGEPQPAQRRNRLDPALIGAVGHHEGRREAASRPAGPSHR